MVGSNFFPAEPPMIAPPAEAAPDYSRGHRVSRPAGPAEKLLRSVLSVVALAGSVALVVATFSTIIEIKVQTTSNLAGPQSTFTGFDRHSIALLLIAVVAMPMALGGLRRSRPAMVLLLLLAAGALFIALVLDLPDLHTTGQVGRDYADASAGAGDGFWAELLGGLLLALAAAGMLVLSGGLPAPPGRRPRPPSRRHAATDVGSPPAPTTKPEPDSWL